MAKSDVIRVGLMGLGVVGGGVARILHEKEAATGSPLCEGFHFSIRPQNLNSFDSIFIAETEVQPLA